MVVANAIQVELAGPLGNGDGQTPTTTPTTGIMVWNGTSWDRLRGDPDNADGRTALGAVGVLRATAELYAFNGSQYDRMRGDATNSLRVTQKQVSVVVEVKSAANTGITITLAAAGAGLFHYITHIRLGRASTAALAGAATLDYTSTNLNGWRITVGNAMAAGGTQIDHDQDYATPLRSAAANTATTIVLPAMGAAVLGQGFVHYYTGPA